MIKPQDMKAGVNYFCTYSVQVDPDTLPVLSQSNETIPVVEVTGKGQILQRDADKELLEVIDLETHQRHVVPFTKVHDIAVAD